MLIQDIEKKYVADDCVQVMFRYKNWLGIKKDGKDIVYFHDRLEREPGNYINKYMEDERRHQFPFSDIPMHTERIRFSKYITVNQILEYDTIYTIVRELDNEELKKQGNEALKLYCKVVKSNDSAIIIQDVILSAPFYMSASELECLKRYKAQIPKVKMKKSKIRLYR